MFSALGAFDEDGRRSAASTTGQYCPRCECKCCKHTQQSVSIAGSVLSALRNGPPRTPTDYESIVYNQREIAAISSTENDFSEAPKPDPSVLSGVSSVGGQGPITLTWRNLNVYVKENGAPTQRSNRMSSVSGGSKGRQIIYNMSGVARPGQLIAIMGASGAGKSTFLNSLTGRNRKGIHIEGDVFVNGHNIGRSITAVSAYVQQDDLFYGALTVREHLYFQAMLRLPSNISRARKLRRVREVLVDLGLAKCQDTIIGVPGLIKGISGGEKKRLAFASEVLTNPSLLFCDEPTTGLDSYMAEGVVMVLKKLAARGKTILCTIHQPASEIFNLFDTVMLIADGRLAYMGDREGALAMFRELNYPCPTTYNPADHYIEQLAISAATFETDKARVARICDTFSASRDNAFLQRDVRESLIEPPRFHHPLNPAARQDERPMINFSGRSPYKSTRLIQFLMLLWRATIGNFRNPAIAITKIGSKAILGLFAGLLYLNIAADGVPSNQAGVQSLKGAHFLYVAQWIYAAVFGVINASSDFPLLVREHHDGIYTVANFYLAQAVALVPVYSLDGIVMIIIGYYMIGFVSNVGTFFLMWLICILTEQSAGIFALIYATQTLITVALGILFTSVSPTFAVAISLAGPIVTLMNLTAGLYANVGSLPVWLSWMQWISFFRYSFEAVSIIQWESVTGIGCNITVDNGCLTDGQQVLASLSFDSTFLLRDCLLLCALIVGWHTFGYMALLYRVYKAR